MIEPLEPHGSDICKCWDWPKLPNEVAVFGFGNLYPAEKIDDIIAWYQLRLGSALARLELAEKGSK